MNRSIVLIVSAITLAAGVALLARALMRPPPPITIVKEVPVAQAPEREVLVAARALAPGDFLAGDSLVWRAMPAADIQAIHFAAAADADRRTLEQALYGATLRRALSEGEPFTRDLLVKAGEPGFLAAVLRPGMRAVSVPTSAVTSNSGLVSAGDWVDVILSLNRDSMQTASMSAPASGPATGAPSSTNPFAQLAAQTLLRRVRVLALNRDTASIAPQARPSSDAADGHPPGAAPARAIVYDSITLEVTPDAAEKLAVAREVGSLQIALRGIRQEAEEGEDDALPAASKVTRLRDTTAIFEQRAGGTAAAPVVVKTFHGAQQGSQNFGTTP